MRLCLSPNSTTQQDHYPTLCQLSHESIFLLGIRRPVSSFYNSFFLSKYLGWEFLGVERAVNRGLVRGLIWTWWAKCVEITILEDGSTTTAKWRIGVGKGIKMWEDVWLVEELLSTKYLGIYLNFVQKWWVVFEMGRWKTDRWVWDLKWQRQWFQWETKSVGASEG